MTLEISGRFPVEWYAYEAFAPHSDWVGPSQRGPNHFDNLDFHVDLGCGTVPKGRIGIDRFPAEGVDIICDFENDQLPFHDSTIRSIISHHCLEHVANFIPLMQEIHRVLVPSGVLRVIVPLFPSTDAVCDPDHKRYFMEDSFAPFLVDDAGNSWMSSFSVPYPGNAKFKQLHKDCSPPTPVEHQWTNRDNREMRIALEAWKP